MSKMFAPQKNGPKFIKIPQDLQIINAPHCAKFHQAQPNDVPEKCYKIFLHPSVYWCPFRWKRMEA